MFLAQTTLPTTPVTVEGAWLFIMIALAMAAPEILKGLGKLISAFADRLAAGTNAQVKGLEVFRVLEEEVAHLREERDADRKRLTDAEIAANEANTRANRFESELDVEREKRYKMQTDIDYLKTQLANKITESQEKDKIIDSQKLRITELERENERLKVLVTTEAN